MISAEALRSLAEYTRPLEEELDGSDAGEGQALIAANAELVDMDAEFGECPENEDGPHQLSVMCVHCLMGF